MDYKTEKEIQKMKKAEMIEYIIKKSRVVWINEYNSWFSSHYINIVDFI